MEKHLDETTSCGRVSTAESCLEEEATSAQVERWAMGLMTRNLKPRDCMAGNECLCMPAEGEKRCCERRSKLQSRADQAPDDGDRLLLAAAALRRGRRGRKRESGGESDRRDGEGCVISSFALLRLVLLFACGAHLRLVVLLRHAQRRVHPVADLGRDATAAAGRRRRLGGGRLLRGGIRCRGLRHRRRGTDFAEGRLGLSRRGRLCGLALVLAEQSGGGCGTRQLKRRAQLRLGNDAVQRLGL